MTFRNFTAIYRTTTPRLVVTSLLALTMVISVLALAPTSDASALGSGVTFGAYAQPINGQSNIAAIQELERELGTKVPLIRGFSDWDDGIGADKNLHTWARDGGRQVMVSIKPRRDNGQRINWRSIANAQPGSTLYEEAVDLASGARRFGEPMIVSFHHEPETNTAYGTSNDFKAAFRRVVEIFRAEGADNVSFAWVMTSWSFEVADFNPNDRRRAELWYPGSDVVDFLAADPYNWNNCRKPKEPWTPLETTIEPFMDFADQYPDKPLILAEWGSDEGATGRKAEWLDDARAMFKSGKHKNRFAAVIYFHDDGREEGWPDCDWWLDSSPETLAASRRLATDSFFRNPVPLGNNPRPTPTPTTTTTTTRPPAPEPTPTPPPPAPTPTPNVSCAGERATIVGTAGADTLRGTNGRDVIAGLGGNDTILGLGGNDLICGGSGNDTIRGGNGADVLYGQNHRDRIFGEDGNDRIVGGQGDDHLIGEAGSDRIDGNSGDDYIRGGSGNDTLRGNGGEDTVIGSGGNDTLSGGRGDDGLFGSSGTDTCTGGPGRTIYGQGCNRRN